MFFSFSLGSLLSSDCYQLQQGFARKNADGKKAEAEKAMTPHSNTLACKIPWMEKPGRLQSMGSLRVGHDRATSLSLFTFMHWRRKQQPTPVFLPRDRGAWWAALYGVAQSRARLKRLSRRRSSSKKAEGSSNDGILVPKQLLIMET